MSIKGKCKNKLFRFLNQYPCFSVWVCKKHLLTLHVRYTEGEDVITCSGFAVCVYAFDCLWEVYSELPRSYYSDVPKQPGDLLLHFQSLSTSLFHTHLIY